ncbi:hypothetical protein RFI_20907, partial [Reticulomyxa filosa]
MLGSFLPRFQLLLSDKCISNLEESDKCGYLLLYNLFSVGSLHHQSALHVNMINQSRTTLSMNRTLISSLIVIEIKFFGQQPRTLPLEDWCLGNLLRTYNYSVDYIYQWIFQCSFVYSFLSYMHIKYAHMRRIVCMYVCMYIKVLDTIQKHVPESDQKLAVQFVKYQAHMRALTSNLSCERGIAMVNDIANRTKVNLKPNPDLIKMLDLCICESLIHRVQSSQEVELFCGLMEQYPILAKKPAPYIVKNQYLLVNDRIVPLYIPYMK